MADKIEKSKKRKKHTDGSSRPSKKVAVEPDQKIKISIQSEDQWAPVVVSTPGVSFPFSIPLKPYTRPRAKTQKKASGPLATTELLLHSNAHPRLEYTFRESEESGGSDALLKHYVGVYDPETGKLEVTEARKMVMRAVLREQAAEEEHFSKTMREQRTELGRAFGTKKAKKALASITENAISQGSRAGKPDSATQAMIASMAKDAEGMATRAELAAQADANKPRPKANLEAVDIKDVYTVESLIGVDILKAVPILEWQQKVKANTNISVSSRYIAGRIKKWGTNLEKLKLLRYLLLLIELYTGSKSTKGKGGFKFLPKREDMKKIGGGMPEPVLESARRQFSTDGQMTKHQSDLLSTHICALACLIDNYAVDMYDLQMDLSLETKAMSQYFTEIGAKITALPEQNRKEQGLDKAAAAQRKMAKLKIPLEFPRVPFNRAPRR